MSLPPGALELLATLTRAELPYVVVGGLAAIAHGAITFTRDVDVALPLTDANLSGLLDALAPLHPRHVTRPDLGVLTDASRLRGFRLLLLETDLGRLDVLGELPPFDDVRALPTVRRTLDGENWVDVLELDALIALKAHVGRPKDKVMEAELRAVRASLQTSD